MCDQRAHELVEKALKSLSAQGKSVLPVHLSETRGRRSAEGNAGAFLPETSGVEDIQRESKSKNVTEGIDSSSSFCIVQKTGCSSSSKALPLCMTSQDAFQQEKGGKEDPILEHAARLLFISEKEDLRHSTDLLWLRQLLRTARIAYDYICKTGTRETKSISYQQITSLPHFSTTLSTSSAVSAPPSLAHSFPYVSSDACHYIRMWCIHHEADCCRRVKELEAQAAQRQYVVQYDPGKNHVEKFALHLGVSSKNETFSSDSFEEADYFKELGKVSKGNPCTEERENASEEIRTENHSLSFSPPIASGFSKEEEEWRGKALLGGQRIPQPTYPNRSFHPSDVVRYPFLECTNTIGLDFKDIIARTTHRHECRRCGTEKEKAVNNTAYHTTTIAAASAGAGAGDTMCFSRYFRDVDAEYRVPQIRKFLHERKVPYEYCHESACIVADALEMLNTEKKQHSTQLEKDLIYRKELSTAASETLSSVHRLRQEGFFGCFSSPTDIALPYTTAYRNTHLNTIQAVKLPPVTRGDGHEGHFYL